MPAHLEQAAIVIQGPIVATHNFSLETIRLYKKNFPGTLIILSTWEGEDHVQIRNIKEEGVCVLENKKPQNPGITNVNFQIHSTAEGIKKAKELGAKHILKTRTDQRIYSPLALQYFDAVLKSFPLNDSSVQRERLVAVSMNTFKYRPYSVSDMTMYGATEDMERYWCIPFSEEKNTLPPIHSMVEWAQAKHAEVYFASQFLESLGYTPLFTLADSWAMYRDRFCVIDKESIDLFWYKYDKEKEYRKIRYDGAYNDQELSFRDWLILYSNPEIFVPEYIIHQQFGKSLN